jgi:hypothetical protein
LEFRLLYYLASRPNRVFTRDQLLDAVWGTDRFVTPRSVDVYVRRLREKIEAAIDRVGNTEFGEKGRKTRLGGEPREERSRTPPPFGPLAQRV